MTRMPLSITPHLTLAKGASLRPWLLSQRLHLSFVVYSQTPKYFHGCLFKAQACTHIYLYICKYMYAYICMHMCTCTVDMCTHILYYTARRRSSVWDQPFGPGHRERRKPDVEPTMTYCPRDFLWHAPPRFPSKRSFKWGIGPYQGWTS